METVEGVHGITVKSRMTKKVERRLSEGTFAGAPRAEEEFGHLLTYLLGCGVGGRRRVRGGRLLSSDQGDLGYFLFLVVHGGEGRTSEAEECVHCD